jgi:hypothetical protein
MVNLVLKPQPEDGFFVGASAVADLAPLIVAAGLLMAGVMFVYTPWWKVALRLVWRAVWFVLILCAKLGTIYLLIDFMAFLRDDIAWEAALGKALLFIFIIWLGYLVVNQLKGVVDGMTKEAEA